MCVRVWSLWRGRATGKKVMRSCSLALQRRLTRRIDRCQHSSLHFPFTAHACTLARHTHIVAYTCRQWRNPDVSAARLCHCRNRCRPNAMHMPMLPFSAAVSYCDAWAAANCVAAVHLSSLVAMRTRLTNPTKVRFKAARAVAAYCPCFA